MINCSYEEYLNRYGKFTFKNKGTSMMPLLREDRDLFTIEKKAVPSYKKYDVVLFKRKNGQYVLHRILKVSHNGKYKICGDHLINSEYDIDKNQILGVMTEVIRDGRTIKVTDKKYLMYVHLWCDLFYIRVFILWTKAKMSAVIRHIRKAHKS